MPDSLLPWHPASDEKTGYYFTENTLQLPHEHPSATQDTQSGPEQRSRKAESES